MPYIINKQGEKISKIYEEILPFSEGYAPFKNNDKWGMLGLDGEIAIPAMYEECKRFGSGLAPSKLNGLWGYINHQNKTAIPFQFENARCFYEDYATVKKVEGESAVIYKDGTLITDFKYRIISWFINGFAAVLTNSKCKWGFINSSGKELPVSTSSVVGFFENGYATIKDDNNKCGIIDTAGAIIIPCQYDEILNVMEDFVAVRNGKLWGFLSMLTAKIEIPFQFKDVKLGFKNGVCFIKKEEHYGAINKKGEQVLPFVFVDIKTPSIFSQNPFSVGLAIVWLDKDKGEVNAENLIVEKSDYDPNKYLEFNLKWNRGNKPTSLFNVLSWGVVSIRETDTGKAIVPFIYRKIEDYSNGLALVKDINHSGYVDTNGNMAIPLADYGFATSFSEERAVVDTHNYYDY